jgi:hypothetical protein
MERLNLKPTHKSVQNYYEALRQFKRSGITNDPNRTDDPEYTIRLIGQAITISLETVQTRKLTRNLSDLRLRTSEWAERSHNRE